MKKNRALCLAAVLMVFSGCQNYDDLIPEDFGTILSLKEVGEVPTNLYTTGEDGVVELTILKGGSDPSRSASAQIEVMSPALLSEYAVRTGVTYDALPGDTYEIAEPGLDFPANTGYLKRQVTLRTAKIQKMIKDHPEANYALPLILTSPSDSVNIDKQILILRPEILVPTLHYELSQKSLNAGAGETEYEFRLKLPFVSPWDFEATVAVAEDQLPGHTTLIPTSEYSLGNGGKAVFKKGNTLSEPVKVTLKEKSNILIGNQNALPLMVTATTKAGVKVPEQPFVLYATEYNRIPLTVDMLSTNAQEPSEGQIAGLVDNDPATYFHSAWSVAPTSDPHHVVATLKQPITRVSFKYQNRANANGKVQDIKIWVYDTQWVELTEINEGLPTGPGSIYSSKTFEAERPFTKFRIDAMRTNSGTAPTFFSFAELYLYGK